MFSNPLFNNYFKFLKCVLVGYVNVAHKYNESQRHSSESKQKEDIYYATVMPASSPHFKNIETLTISAFIWYYK